MVDANGDPVQNATVTLGWDDGKKTGTKTCITASNGRCTVSTTNGKKRSRITFTVNSATHATLMYDAAGNCDPDFDSDGTTIVISKP